MMDINQIKLALPKEPLMQIDELPYKKIASGKVRELYDLGEYVLIIATDRISAFDVIMPNGVPGKGILLTQISLWWFEQAGEIMQTHIPEDHEDLLEEKLKDFKHLIPYSMIVKKLKTLPIEAVVRGYITGSGWSQYQKAGSIFDIELPEGMKESQKFEEPIFTPTTKAAQGHDMPMTHAQGEELLGEDLFWLIKDTSIKLYEMGLEKALKSGLILADTKFEFGKDEDGNVYLIDEVLTPDSSRYWPLEKYEIGKSQPSYDKQFVRDYLSSLTWDKNPPAPALPQDVIDATISSYLTALEKLMG